MPLDEIKKSIESTTSGEVEKLKREAEAEKERIIKEAKEKADMIVKDAAEKANEEARMLEETHKANLDFEVNSIRMSARNEAINRELLVIRKAVSKEIEKHINELFKVAIKEFSKIVGTGEITVVAGKKYANMAKNAGLRMEVKEIDGFMLRNSDGTIALNSTKESMVEKSVAKVNELVAGAIGRDMHVATGTGRKAHGKEAGKKVRKKARRNGSKG